MPATIRTSVTALYNGASPATALPMTCVAGDRLILLAGTHNSNGLLSGATFNGVAFTPIGTEVDVIIGCNILYLDNPTAGTFNLALSSASNFSALGYCCVAIQGANMGAAPVIGTGSTASSASASCAVTGGGANDLYLACSMNLSATITAAGAPQVNLASYANINTSGSYSGDYIPGASAGNFGWTLPSGPWVAIGCLVAGTSSAGGGGAMTGAITRGVTDTIDQTVTGIPV